MSRWYVLFLNQIKIPSFHLGYNVKIIVMIPSVDLLLESEFKITKYTIIVQLSYILMISFFILELYSKWSYNMA